MNKIFICYTPYHFLLSYLFKYRETEDLIILIDQYNNLEKWEFSLNKEEGVSYIKHSDAKSIFKLKSRITSIIKTYSPSNELEVYVFNDRTIDTWIALSCINKKIVHYIEDGSSAYSNSIIRGPKFKRLMLVAISKLPFTSYEYIEVLGTSSTIVSGYYLYPEHVRKENTLKPALQYQISTSHIENLKKFLIALSDFNQHSAIEVLALLPSTREQSFFNTFKSAVENLAKNKALIYKKHPIDNNNFQTQASNHKELPSHYPAEALLFTGSPDIVIGNFTTTLYATRFFAGRCKCINVHTMHSRKANEVFYEFLSSIGVHHQEIADPS